MREDFYNKCLAENRFRNVSFVAGPIKRCFSVGSNVDFGARIFNIRPANKDFGSKKKLAICCSWSPDNERVAVAGTDSANISIYSISSGFESVRLVGKRTY